MREEEQMNAIQKMEPSVSLDHIGGVRWTRDLMDLCKRTVCPKGVTDDEFAVFMEQCRATGLNPFTKEAYCVPRNVKVSKKGEQERWETVHTFQPSIGGARSRAGRFPDFHSSTSAAVYERDTCEVDVDAGEVRHKFNPCAQRGQLKGAWGKVTKKSGPPIVVWLPVGSRSGNSTFWQQDPGGMMAKCAEFAALAKAYPVQFGGLQIPEETEEAAPTRVEAVLGRLNGQAVETHQPEPLPPVGPVVEFGEWKGRPVSGLSIAETIAALAFADAKLAEAKPGAKWVKKMEENRNVIEWHRFELESAAPKPAPDAVDAEFTEAPANEPGSEG